MNTAIIKVFLRLSIAMGFLSAVADRFGLWNQEVSVWGNWQSFLDYTQSINPWLPSAAIPLVGGIATAAEVLFALCLLIGFNTEFIAKLSGILLLIFALSMSFSSGVKGAFDYSVFIASAGAFALSAFKQKYWEIDTLMIKSTA